MKEFGLRELEQRTKEWSFLRKKYAVHEKGIEELERHFDFFGEIFWLFANNGYRPDFDIDDPGRITCEGAEFHVKKEGRRQERKDRIAEFMKTGATSIKFGLLELSIQRKKDLFPECSNVVYLFDFVFVLTFLNFQEERDIFASVCELGYRFGFSIKLLDGFSYLLRANRKEIEEWDYET